MTAAVRRPFPFYLGGHSLLAVGPVGRLRDALGVDAPVHAVFSARVVADPARTLQNASATKRPALRRVNRSATS
ncbi:hypothetical protein GCM10018785_53080 [Streptomyces longispororuber]|uniref:Carrier domain-containing protein n=1 Tax=Streptomyces longispororuber TaxID=68230 RepID=A0A919DTW3_9ACTN|nr:phosphopantetheine-binding protein [Streptomyces longispororuber]GHE78225.1 hypothetical protein GCM10018785_53080 [Streptomyces longispororuber]